MNPQGNPTHNDAQDLADLLSSRVDTLAAAARDAVAAIEADQAGHRDRSAMADELIDSVTARIGGIAADCDELNRILAGFRSLMEATPAPAPAPTPEPLAPESQPAQPAAPSAPVTVAPGITDFSGTGAVEPVQPVEPQREPTDEPTEAPQPQAQEAPVEPPEPPKVSEGVRLLATQMSVAGSSVAEIARRLRDEFGVENSDLLVRELFGEPEPVRPDPGNGNG